jgi:aromatic-L-amino-acid decarboxylase
VKDSPNLEIVTAPNLALTVFRAVPRGGSPNLESLNSLNRLFFGRLSARPDIMLTQTTLNCVFCIRFAVGAARTTEAHIQQAFTLIEKEAELAIETWGQTINGMLTVG